MSAAKHIRRTIAVEQPHPVTARARELHQEIEWLASFRWPIERIASRLGVSVACVERHLAGERGVA